MGAEFGVQMDCAGRIGRMLLGEKVEGGLGSGGFQGEVTVPIERCLA